MEGVIVITPAQLTDLIATTVKTELAKYIPAPQKTDIAPPPIEYLTAQQVRSKLKISRPTLKRWTDEGKIKGYRLGSRVRYKSNEIEGALQAMTITIIPQAA